MTESPAPAAAAPSTGRSPRRSNARARNARAPSREDDEDEALRGEAAEEEQPLPAAVVAGLFELR